MNAVINNTWFKEHYKPVWKNSHIFYFYNENNKRCFFIIRKNRNLILYKSIFNRIFYQV